ncbi:MAG: hypothetical protein JST88_00640 [Bacteroidetes bacterium]|nr:hypothetical protein [Bacteroidota bacterium]
MDNYFNFIAITNNVSHAQAMAEAGVQQIMVDTEILGKVDRQKGKQTVINTHQISDVALLKGALSNQVKIICRINKYNNKTQQEIEEAGINGADAIMIPMISNMNEYEKIVNNIPESINIIPLIETPYSAFKLLDIIQCRKPEQIHFGLNDLFIALGMKNLFEIIFSNLFRCLINEAKEHVPLVGIGGIGNPNTPQKVDPNLLIKEYVSIGSNSVILSRSFFGENYNKDEISAGIKKINEVASKPFTQQQYIQLKEQIKILI